MTWKSVPMVTVAVVALAVAGCGDGAPNPPAGSPAGAPAQSAPVVPSPQAQERRSQPYWVPVISLTGTGATTTKTFTIDGRAVQWRATWSCTSAPFTFVSVNSAGKASSRKLGYALSCPSTGQGFSAETGPQSLRVTSNSGWKVDIEQQLDVALVEPLAPALASARIVSEGTVYKVDKDAEGTARIYRATDGALTLRLEHFYVSRNSDLELRFSPVAVPTTTGQIAAAPFRAIAPLKATLGDMNYELPRDIDLSAYGSIVIWCEATRNAYAAASLKSL